MKTTDRTPISPAPFDHAPFDIVGFDLDGTLVDSSIELAASLNHTLEGSGRRPIAPEKVKSLVGMGAGHMLEMALAQSGPVDAEEVRALIAILLAHYEENLGSNCPVFPGLPAAMDALQDKGVRLAVVTNKFEYLATRLLGNIDLLGRFEAVIGGDTMGKGKGKPQPDPIHEMIARCGGGRAAFVGDAWPDFAAAKAAGIPCVGVSFGYVLPASGEHRADLTIDHYDDLLPALARLTKTD